MSFILTSCFILVDPVSLLTSCSLFSFSSLFSLQLDQFSVFIADKSTPGWTVVQYLKRPHGGGVKTGFVFVSDEAEAEGAGSEWRRQTELEEAERWKNLPEEEER